MSAIRDVLVGYLCPKKIARKRLAESAGEGQALGYLISACLLLYVAQIPEIVRNDMTSVSEHPLVGIAAGRLLGIAVFAPLLFYAVAGLAGLALRIGSGQASWTRSRIALFWALLAVAPAAMALGVLRGLTDAQSILLPASIAVAGLFLLFWICGLQAATRQ